MNKEKVPNNIKKYREMKGFTQEQLAVMVGVDRTTINNYESLYRNPPLSIFIKIALALNVDLDDLANMDTIKKTSAYHPMHRKAGKLRTAEKKY